MLLALLPLLLPLALADHHGEPAPDRPNVVIIVTDDAGYIDYGFSSAKGGVVPTPNIDSIAQQGVTFTQGYTTASVCSPSRAGIMTGRYQQRFGHEYNLAPRALENRFGTPPEEITIAEALRELGYQTYAVGKWHLGPAEGFRPTDQGFDHFAGLYGGSRSYFQDPEPNHSHTLRDGTNAVPEPDGLYMTNWLGERAIEFIGNAEEDDTRPFFMYLSYTAPHTPMDALPEDLDAVGEHESELRKTYAAMTRSLDRSIGEVLAALDDAGESGNTLVFFLNDNGGATNNGSDNGPFRGMKGSKWEGGIRVPFAARFPGHYSPGTTLDEPVMAFDMYPTAVVAAGGIPGDLLDGVDLTPAITGGDASSLDRTLFWRRGVAAAVRRGDWKLVRSKGNPTLLFNLRLDPSERNNVAGEQPELVTEMLGALEQWESELAEPGWVEAPRWSRNQIMKHRMEVDTREEEREFP